MTAPTVAEERTTPIELTERCDRCGAQAYFRAVFTHGELLFCGHHGRELMGRLQNEAILVEDCSNRIPV
jgi:hypothetical protein